MITPPPLTPPATFPLPKHCFYPPGPKRVALGFSQNSPTCSRHVGGEGACPRGRDGESSRLPGVGTSQGVVGKEPSSKRRAWPLPRCKHGALQPPLPGASRPWVGNPARCGKRSWDGGCQATLIQPLTNFQHFASAAESNQQMIKRQVPLRPVVSICPSIERRGLLVAPCLGCPARRCVPPSRIPRGQPRTSCPSQQRFAGAGFDP